MFVRLCTWFSWQMAIRALSIGCLVIVSPDWCVRGRFLAGLSCPWKANRTWRQRHFLFSVTNLPSVCTIARQALSRLLLFHPLPNYAPRTCPRRTTGSSKSSWTPSRALSNSKRASPPTRLTFSHPNPRFLPNCLPPTLQQALSPPNQPPSRRLTYNQMSTPLDSAISLSTSWALPLRLDPLRPLSTPSPKMRRSYIGRSFLLHLLHNNDLPLSPRNRNNSNNRSNNFRCKSPLQGRLQPCVSLR